MSQYQFCECANSLKSIAQPHWEPLHRALADGAGGSISAWAFIPVWALTVIPVSSSATPVPGHEPLWSTPVDPISYLDVGSASSLWNNSINSFIFYSF